MKLTLRIPDDLWQHAAQTIRPLQGWSSASPILRMWQAIIEGRWRDYDRARADLNTILRELDRLRASEPSRPAHDPGWTR